MITCILEGNCVLQAMMACMLVSSPDNYGLTGMIKCIPASNHVSHFCKYRIFAILQDNTVGFNNHK